MPLVVGDDVPIPTNLGDGFGFDLVRVLAFVDSMWWVIRGSDRRPNQFVIPRPKAFMEKSCWLIIHRFRVYEY